MLVVSVANSVTNLTGLTGDAASTSHDDPINTL